MHTMTRSPADQADEPDPASEQKQTADKEPKAAPAKSDQRKRDRSADEPSAKASSSASVTISDFEFTPASVTVNEGDTVTWTNMDEAPHTVTVSSGPVKFASPTLQKGQSFTYTFKKAGTYSYYCAVHPDMKATVKVTGSSTSPTPSTPTPTPGHTGHGGRINHTRGGVERACARRQHGRRCSATSRSARPRRTAGPEQ